MSVWYLVGAVLVFFMQCGFAMVETGFTRAKNAGNIIMKNLMDFCIGTMVFMLLGYGIMNSEHYFFGLIGRPEYQLFTDFYGFNGAAASDPVQMAWILGNTTIAPAVATVSCMIFTWIKSGKPDVSMCLNASLAGLVAITAPCATVDALGAFVIGAVAGILVDVVVEVLDFKLHIDDPVGAVGVHCANGIWGTIAEGLFNTDSGLFYGGGFAHLGVQLLGFASIALYTAVVMTVVFRIIKATAGLRASAEEEIMGLDITEHGLTSAYADFLPSYPGTIGGESTSKAVDVSGLEPLPLTPHLSTCTGSDRLTRVSIICKEERFPVLRDTMAALGVIGMTVSNVMGCGEQLGKTGQYRGVEMSMNFFPKVQVDIVVSKISPELVVAAAQKALRTGGEGDGKIFVYNVENVVKVRTGETDYDALQDEAR